jgi:glycosyltransferase involved in cell wall biosynthesis
MNGMLVFFHCPSNSGYAISRLERVFLEAARQVVGRDERIHFAYPSLSGGQPRFLPSSFDRVIEFDPTSKSPRQLANIERYVRDNRLTVGLGFDQPVRRPGYASLRGGGMRTFVSYWGAPMSSINSGVKLALKRLDALLARGGPDHYIFESQAMVRTAVEGRGLPQSRTSVTYLGVDPAVFRPPDAPSWYAHDALRIPRDRAIVYYSGHMEERKGVHVLVKAFVHLVEARNMRNAHLVILGNRNGEERAFDSLYRGRVAEGFITFAGYRGDVEKLIPCAYLGAIASTGWDSFTMSSLEIAACGVPLIVSKLQGLEETVQEGRTGYTFPPGDHIALSDRIALLLSDPAHRAELGAASRQRIIRDFTIERQIESLATTIRTVAERTGGTLAE